MNAFINETTYKHELKCIFIKVMVNTAKKRKSCISSLNPDLFLEDRQAPTDDVELLGACILQYSRSILSQGYKSGQVLLF